MRFPLQAFFCLRTLSDLLRTRPWTRSEDLLAPIRPADEGQRQGWSWATCYAGAAGDSRVRATRRAVPHQQEMGKGSGGGGVTRQGAASNAGFDQLGGPIPSNRRVVVSGWSRQRGQSTARASGATIVASLGHATPRGHGGGGSELAGSSGDAGAASPSIQWGGDKPSLASRCSSAGTSNTSGDLDSSCRSASSRDLDLTSMTSTDITAVQRYGRTPCVALR